MTHARTHARTHMFLTCWRTVRLVVWNLWTPSTRAEWRPGKTTKQQQEEEEEKKKDSRRESQQQQQQQLVTWPEGNSKFWPCLSLFSSLFSLSWFSFLLSFLPSKSLRSAAAAKFSFGNSRTNEQTKRNEKKEKRLNSLCWTAYRTAVRDVCVQQLLTGRHIDSK